MIDYLDLEDVLPQVQRMGFAVRDLGLLESAVARPQASAFGQDAYPTLWLKAAALIQSIDHNQALVDGNKRLAWSTGKVFVRINGQKLTADADEGEYFMLDVVRRGGDLGAVASWLQTHCPIDVD